MANKTPYIGTFLGLAQPLLARDDLPRHRPYQDCGLIRTLPQMAIHKPTRATVFAPPPRCQAAKIAHPETQTAPAEAEAAFVRCTAEGRQSPVIPFSWPLPGVLPAPKAAWLDRGTNPGACNPCTQVIHRPSWPIRTQA
jgi:hypothetical protein